MIAIFKVNSSLCFRFDEVMIFVETENVMLANVHINAQRMRM